MSESSSRSVWLFNNDSTLAELAAKFDSYCESEPEVLSAIDRIIWALHNLQELIPGTVENVFSPLAFPLDECRAEFECSLLLLKHAFYKQAFSGLRNVLELGLLSGFWLQSDEGHKNIRKWHNGKQPTPFKRDIFAKLFANANVADFDSRRDLRKSLNYLYGELANYSHTCGHKYSSRANTISPTNCFTESIVDAWVDVATKSVEYIISVHLLLFPIGLHETDIESKFGINGPISGFLNSWQRERLESFFDADTLAVMRDICLNDQDAIQLANWLSDHPDITEEELNSQFVDSDRSEIRHTGWRLWFRNQRKLYTRFRLENPDLFKRKVQYWWDMRRWSRNEGIPDIDYKRFIKD